MLSWILRHRARLQVIYGRVDAPPLAGARFAAGPRVPAVDRADERRGLLRPGDLRRRSGGQIELRPMPRRVA